MISLAEQGQLVKIGLRTFQKNIHGWKMNSISGEHLWQQLVTVKASDMGWWATVGAIGNLGHWNTGVDKIAVSLFTIRE